MNAVIINKFGTVQGWNNITVNILGRDLEGINKVTYEDTQAKENVYGAGAMPIGRSRGNYEPTASIGLLKEEVDALKRSLPRGKRIQDIQPFDMIVKYEVDGLVMVDIVRNCEFKNNGVDVSQSDGSISTDFELICSHIDWNVI